MPRFPLPCVCVLSVTIASAQVSVGEIAATGFSTTTFGVLNATNQVRGYTTTGFQGSGPATSQTILWDPAQPDSFLVGGFGFLGRATVTGPTQVNYTLLATGVGIVSQLSWDPQGRVVIADSGTGQMRQFDPVTLLLTDLSTGTQPWGQDLNAGAIHPISGDLIVGGNGEIYRLASGATVATTIVTGLGGYVTGIAFDPVTGETIATVLTVNRVIRIAANGAVSDVAPNGSVPGPNALAVDHNGNFVAGGGTGQIYRIPRSGGAPTFLANNTSPFGNVNGLAVVGGSGYCLPFGLGCAGAGGPVELRATGPFRVGSTLVTTSTNHAANALGVAIYGLSRVDHGGVPLPFVLDGLLGTANCALRVSIDATVIGFAGAGSPANLQFSVPLTAAFAGRHLRIQHACFEPVAGGTSWSNGLELQVP